MLGYALIFALIGAANSQSIINLVDELIKDGGKWILAGVGSTGRWLSTESCINITVTETGNNSECILANHNLTPHKVRIIKIVGTNEENHVVFTTQGPVHQYMIKGHFNKSVHAAVKGEVDFDSAINTPFCWHDDRKNIHDVRFIISPIDKTTDHILLIGIKVRMPVPEYHVAILTKEKMPADELEAMTSEVNYKNRMGLYDSCVIHKITEQKIKQVKSDRMLIPYCLPRVYKSCAKDVYWKNNPEFGMYLWDLPNDIHDIETVLVKHLQY